METVIAQQIKELKSIFFMTSDQVIQITLALQIAYMEGEKAQMIKQMEGLKNGN